MNTTQPIAATNRNKIVGMLQAMTTSALIDTMRELDKRADDACDMLSSELYMIAFNVLASRVGCDMAESYSDEIMNAR